MPALRHVCRLATPITADKLETTEWAEDYLFSLGFTNFRVRYMNGCARIQLPASQWQRLADNRQSIHSYLKQRYRAVLLDLEVRDEQ